jgi:iron complex transport system substrate-binding protein
MSIIFSLSFCINKSGHEKDERTASNEQFQKIELHHAKGFSVDYFEGGKHLKVLHPKTGEVLDEMLLIAKEDCVIPEEFNKLKQFKLPLQNYVSQSTTHVSYLDKINQLDELKAVSFTSYIKNKNAVKRIESGTILELTNGNSLNKELLIDLAPELIFMYPFDQQVVESIKEHLPIVLTTEYLELDPLAKAEWVKFFALFFNAEEKANSYFNLVEEDYIRLRKSTSNGEQCFLNLPYQNVWNCPPGNSYTGQLLKDAGLNYLYSDVSDKENLKKTSEEIIDECIDVPYWIVFGARNSGYSLSDLKAEQDYYAEFNSVQNQNVIMCNTAESDYFGDALVEPHFLLEDLITVLSGDKEVTRYFYRLKE